MSTPGLVIFSNSGHYEVQGLYLMWDYQSFICNDNVQVSTHACPWWSVQSNHLKTLKLPSLILNTSY